jgi:hypothetical protein
LGWPPSQSLIPIPKADCKLLKTITLPFFVSDHLVRFFGFDKDDFLVIFGSSCRELGGLLFAHEFSPHGQTSNQEDKEYG